MHRTRRPTLWATLLFALTAVPLSAQVPVTRIGLGYDGSPANNTVHNAGISADGRYIALESYASNLVRNDTNKMKDVFVEDRLTGTIVQASLPSSDYLPNAEANGSSWSPSISADGRYIAFLSTASNLVPNDTNYASDIFVRDLSNNTTKLVSVSSTGQQFYGGFSQPTLSADGRFLAFTSPQRVSPDDNAGLVNNDCFVRDLTTGKVVCASVALPNQTTGYADVAAFGIAISADGRYVAFVSSASNLVEGDTNGTSDVFVRDLQAKTTERVSVSSEGIQSNGYSNPNYTLSMSGDGRYVLFASTATDLVDEIGVNPGHLDGYIHDRLTHTTTRAIPSAKGVLADWYDLCQLSANGRYVLCLDRSTSNEFGKSALCVYDRVGAGVLRLREKNPKDYSAATISADGRYVVYSSYVFRGPPLWRTNEHTMSAGPLTPLDPGLIIRQNGPGHGTVAVWDGSTYLGTSDGRLLSNVIDGYSRPGFPVNVSALVGTPVSLLGRPAVYGYSGATGEPALYLTTDKGHVVKLGLDGKLHWKAQPDPTATRCSSTPAVTSNGQVFVGLNGALGPRVFRLDARTGSVVAASVWLGKGTGDITSLAVVGDRVYGGVTDGAYGSLVMLDATSLFPLARSIAPGEGVTAPPYVLGQWAWAGTLTGNLYKMSVNTFNPDPLFDKAGGSGKAEIAQPIPGGIFPGADRLYVGTSQGKVFAIDPVTGSGKSTPFYDTGTTEPINGVLVDKASNTLHFGCGSTFYSVPLANPSTARKEAVEGKLLSSPVLDPWTRMVIVATDTGNLYRFNP